MLISFFKLKSNASHMLNKQFWIRHLLNFVIFDALRDLVVLFGQLKNVKNTHGCVLLLAKLQASAYNFTKSNTPPWVSLTFLKLYKCHQIAQRITIWGLMLKKSWITINNFIKYLQSYMMLNAVVVFIPLVGLRSKELRSLEWNWNFYVNNILNNFINKLL